MSPIATRRTRLLGHNWEICTSTLKDMPSPSEQYAEALALNPKDVNVSTDLGVSYYYNKQIDLALKQFEHSLKIDPKHTKTMLNIGIVRAFGKQDLKIDPVGSSNRRT